MNEVVQECFESVLYSCLAVRCSGNSFPFCPMCVHCNDTVFCRIFFDCSDFSFSVVFNLCFCSKATTCMMYTGIYIYIFTDTVDSLFKGTCQPKLHQSDFFSLHTLHSYLGNQSSKQILPGGCWVVLIMEQNTKKLPCSY